MPLVSNPLSSVGQKIGCRVVREFPGPSLELAWRDCLDRVDFPAHYNAPEYFLDAKQAEERRFALLATDQDRVTGVLTAAIEKPHAECGLQSRPQICMDQGADAVTTATALARGFLAEARAAKLLTVYSWSRLEGFMECGFRERALPGVVVLDLTRGPDLLFKQLDKKRRNCIRFAMRQPLEIVEAVTEEDIAAFYSVYSRWFTTARKKIAGRKLSLEFFRQRFRLRENVRVFLARSAGHVIAGITLRFFPGGLVEYSNNSSLDEFLHLKPNDLLLWHAIEWACREGFSRFSLGGAHRFLREFGGTLTPIYRYRLDRTPFRRHDLRENLLDWGRLKLRQLPQPLEAAVRGIAGKARPKTTGTKNS
ncbi:MAG: GNAT family N-acetyltransferase [Candidatus Sulfotelmatobacter sp.]